MGGFIDLVGQVFGRLSVISRADNYEYFSKTQNRVIKFARFNCLCHCGNSCTYLSQDIRKGKVVSCGCFHSELVSTHGMSGTRPYLIWESMLNRCRDNSNSNYGGRGISYSNSWSSFESFWEDMKDGYDDDLELDRIDVNGDYCKDNCRWVTRSLQAFNKRATRFGEKVRVGVYLDGTKYVARMNVGGTNLYLGRFLSFEDAVKAREEAEILYFGEVKHEGCH